MFREHYTAKEMAELSHNLSRDGMTATMGSGFVYRWSNHFNVWAGPFHRQFDDPPIPRLPRRTPRSSAKMAGEWRN